MIYLGVDIHKKNCWVTVLEGDGRIRDQRKLSMAHGSLLDYFGKVEGPAAVAVEATFNWYYFLDVIEPLGLELHLVHPLKTRAIASARIKHDKLDSRILAELLRTGFLAEAWIAPREVRQLRQLLRFRVRSVQWATRAKNCVQGILNRNGVESPVRTLFSRKGQAFLKTLELPSLDRWEVDDQQERLELLGEQIQELNEEIRERAQRDPVAKALEEIPGIGPFTALLLVAEMGEVRRFPTAKHWASYAGLAPSLYASGEKRWTGAVTKQGSSLLRWALVEAAHRAARHPQFSGFYQRQRERHGPAKAAVALARKLATVVYYRGRAAESSGAHLAEGLVGTSTHEI
jgi:transposase